MNEELLVSRMNEIENLILALRREVKESKTQITDSKPQQKYFTLKEAVEMKYGKNFPYTTISTNYALMPCGNTNYEIHGGRRMWESRYIYEWMEISDKDVISYLEKYHVPLRGRIGEKYLKKYKKEKTICP